MKGPLTDANRAYRISRGVDHLVLLGGDHVTHDRQEMMVMADGIVILPWRLPAQRKAIDNDSKITEHGEYIAILAIFGWPAR